MRNSQRALVTLIVATAVLFGGAGCASFGMKIKNFMAGKSTSSKMTKSKRKAYRYSNRKNLSFSGRQKHYKRMTKERFEEEARLSEEAGSLWVMEGQGSYLFTQNMVRLTGDILRIRLDGQPRQQLSTKVAVLKKLMLRHSRAKRRLPASLKPGAKKKGKAAKKKAEAKKEKKPAQVAKKSDADKDDEKDVKSATFGVKFVPTRIVEQLADGSYRVKGNSSFMIGRREYRVIISGLVRPNDIADDGVRASKLIDAKFDIVSLKRQLKL